MNAEGSVPQRNAIAETVSFPPILAVRMDAVDTKENVKWIPVNAKAGAVLSPKDLLRINQSCSLPHRPITKTHDQDKEHGGSRSEGPNKGDEEQQGK